MAAIRVEGITKTYNGRPILQPIALDIADGELVAVLGRSGVGKSTLLKIIAGLTPPDSGRILFDGASVDRMPVEERGAVLVFQDHVLFPHLTVWQNVAFGLKVAKQPLPAMKRAVAEWLRMVQMEGCDQKYPAELSGGQKQRVALARALAVSPRVLLLDEPFSSLDPELRESTRQFVRDLQRKTKLTTILVTHDWEEALMLSDKLAVLADGRLAQYGRPQEVYFHPATMQVAQLMGSDRNYIPGSVQDGVFHSAAGNFPVLGWEDGEYTAIVHAEQIGVRSSPDGPWIISRTQFAGSSTLLHLEGPLPELIGRIKTGPTYATGDRASVCIDFAHARLFRRNG